MKNIFKRLYIALAISALLFLALRPDQAHAIAAFPGAEGGGATSLGGRGGQVIKVTTLANAGAGSLRACVDAVGPRTCVFTIGGQINLTSSLTINNPFLTIAGQTAPGNGITLAGKTMAQTMVPILDTHDIVIRYIRIRKGYNGSCPGECGSGVLINGSTKVVLDHVTQTWNQDEGMGVGGRTNTNITFSYNLVGEAVGTSTERHSTSYGLLRKGVVDSLTNIDLHHNLTMNNANRNPLARLTSSRIVNNLWYNIGNGTHASGPASIDIINNKWKIGPVSGGEPEVGAFGQSDRAPGTPSLFMLGNVGKGQTTAPSDQFTLARVITSENGPATTALPASWRRSTQLTALTHPITVQAVSAIEDDILPIVGASRRLDCEGKWVINRDTHDEKMVAQYTNNTGPSRFHNIGEGEGFYGTYPVLQPGTACTDTDNDGMPNNYETINGYSPTVADQNTVLGSGFTRLETFLAGETGVTPPPEGDKFQDGDIVYVNATSVNVRNEPTGTPGTILGTQVQDAQGEVTDGPLLTTNGVVWWEIDFDSGTDGWVGEGPLELVVDVDTPPEVAVTAPAAGATVQGASVSVTASASDNVGVVGVQFKLDGANLGAEDTTSTYGITWDTTAVANGSHVLTAVARDAAGNTTTSEMVTVTVNNVASTNFQIGETTTLGTNDTVPVDVINARPFTLSQRATLQSMTIQTNSTAGQIRMGIYDDDGTGGDPGTLLAETSGAITPVAGFNTHALNASPTLDPGTYHLAFVTDGSAVVKGTSTGGTLHKDTNTFGALTNPFVESNQLANNWRWTIFATFTPAQDTTAPATAITAPSAGPVSGASVAVTASASDAVGVVGVSFHAVSPGGAPDATNIIGVEDTTSTYGVTWDTTTWVNGPYNLHSVARDAAGNKTTSAAVAVTVENELDPPDDLEIIRDTQ